MGGYQRDLAMRKVLDAHGAWHPVNSIMPPLPDPADPRGETTSFHGRYRGPHNTGIPDKSALKTPRFGGFFNTPNQTFNDEHFIGFVEVRAAGVTFNRCYFEGRGDTSVVNATVPATFIDCEMNGNKYIISSTVATGRVHCIRCHIYGGGQDIVGFDTDGQYDDCYIHGNVPHFGTHSDSAQTLSGDNLAVRRSKLLSFDPVSNSPTNFNSVFELGATLPGTIDGLELTDNYIDGGGFTMNGNLEMPEVSNVSIQGNRWGRHAAFGPVGTRVVVDPPYGTFDRVTNVFDDDGTAVA
jgi:hypothetical protein